MYYKIENKECDVYKKLHKMRTEEIQNEKENRKLIDGKTGLTFENYIGHSGQQNLTRVTSYFGFEFTEPDKVDLKIWQRHKEHPEMFVPNKRTKLGREMKEFLSNGIKRSDYRKPLEILGLTKIYNVTFPFVEIVGDLILLFLGNNDQPEDENVIEITSKEFKSILE